MKVMLINAYCGWGSTGKIVEGIADTLIQQGHEAYIAYGYYKTDRPNTMKLKLGGRYQNFYEIMKCRLTGYFGFTSKQATFKLIKWIKTVQPDIINLHILHSGYLHIEILFNFLAKANIPIVWTFHDCWAFTGHCAHFTRVKCEKWKTGCFDCPEKDSYPIRYFFDRSKEQYARKKAAFTSVKNMTIVTPSNWLADLVKQSFMGYGTVEVIHNGIDLEVFRPREADVKSRYGIEGKKLVLSVAASWGKRKGLNYLYELAKRLPEDQYQVMVVGLNETQLRELPKGIIGIGRTRDQIELAEIYSAADVFVNPTLEDNYPTVNLESIACGTPVVTFSTGGSPESITLETGAVVSCADMKDLIDKVISWSNKNVHNECRRYAEQNFGKQERFADYARLFEKIIL